MRVPMGIARIVLASLLPGPVAAATHVQEFPFQFKEGMLWVQVQAVGVAKPLNFLLDSGAGVSVLDLRAARSLGVWLGRRVCVQAVGASTSGFWPERLQAS